MVELAQAPNGMLKKSFAGDVLNTLWYVKQILGKQWHAQFFTAVGNDPISEEMQGFIADAGIDVDLVERISDRRPGLYMIHLDGAERSFSYWREQSAARLLAANEDSLARAIDGASVIYFSGITLAILSENHLDVFLNAIGKAKAGGKTIAFDPNIRPALWADENKMREAITRAAGLSTFVLPSFDDEMAAFGDDTPADTLQRYLAADAQSIIVKNGADGILVSHENEIIECTIDAVLDAVDTTGAGDSFNGAFMAEFLTSHDVVQAVKAGQKCAARVIRHHGALVKLEDT